MICVFGDESSSIHHATYGLLAVDDFNLAKLSQLVSDAKAGLGSPGTAEPLHCKVLFHGDRRKASSYRSADFATVFDVCKTLVAQLSRLDVWFVFGRVDRRDAPKILDVGNPDGSDGESGKVKVELAHLQILAYWSAATVAADVLKREDRRVIVDQNRVLVRWQNERRQVWRMFEKLMVSKIIGPWPSQITAASSRDHPGLQVADILSYCMTKRTIDPRFSEICFPLMFKTEFAECNLAD